MMDAARPESTGGVRTGGLTGERNGHELEDVREIERPSPCPCYYSSNALVTSSDALVTGSFLFLVVMPGASRS